MAGEFKMAGEFMMTRFSGDRPTVLPAPCVGTVMELESGAIDEYAAEYRAEEPLYPVERESIESLPDAFRAGEYGPRDAQWVVRWYFRRYLSAYPHDERTTIEDRFADVDMGRVKSAIAEAIEAIDGNESDAHENALESLTRLPGVDVRVGSAFLTFLDPDSYLPIGEREWAVLRESGSLTEPYPSPPTIEEYGRFLEAARECADAVDRDLRTLHLAIWRRWKETNA